MKADILQEGFSMFNMIPDDYPEALAKLSWLKSHGYPDATEEGVLRDTVLSGAQDLFNEALEESYWTVLWDVQDKKMWVRGVHSERVGELIPRENFDTFEEDFKDNAYKFWENLGSQVNTIVGSD